MLGLAGNCLTIDGDVNILNPISHWWPQSGHGMLVRHQKSQAALSGRYGEQDFRNPNFLCGSNEILPISPIVSSDGLRVLHREPRC